MRACDEQAAARTSLNARNGDASAAGVDGVGVSGEKPKTCAADHVVVTVAFADKNDGDDDDDGSVVVVAVVAFTALASFGNSV
jgi:hypothetical protein